MTVNASTANTVKLFLDLSTHPVTVITGIKDGLEGTTMSILQATTAALSTIATFGELIKTTPGLGTSVAGLALVADWVNNGVRLPS